MPKKNNFKTNAKKITLSKYEKKSCFLYRKLDLSCFFFSFFLTEKINVSNWQQMSLFTFHTPLFLSIEFRCVRWSTNYLGVYFWRGFWLTRIWMIWISMNPILMVKSKFFSPYIWPFPMSWVRDIQIEIR